jgi:hypothetical protein
VVLSNKIMGNGKSDYHIVTTAHPYMIELGLGSFTMETLYNWWNERSSDGKYLHRLCINEDRDDLDEPANGLRALLGITDSTEFFWHGWKPNRDTPNAGVYQRYDLSGYSSGGNSPWEYQSPAVGNVTVNNTLLSDVGSQARSAPLVGGRIDADGDYKSIHATPGRSSSLADPAHEIYVLKDLLPIYDLIKLNRYMSDFYAFYPRSTWDETDPTIGGLDTKKLFASHELLFAIKTSKMGGRYIEWSGEVTFFINEGNLCAGGITEWIPFKLHLFDDANADVSDKTVTIKSLKYAAPKTDTMGRKYGSKIDGEYEDHDNEDSSSLGLGELDLAMNPLTQKWESGSPVLLAAMTTKLARAITPDLGGLKTSDIKLALESEEYSYSKFIPASGTAMPIRLQNGNPLQWQPNYLQPKDVRCEDPDNIDYTKETLTVYNFSSESQFEENEMVMLTRIDGVWQASAIGPKGSGDAAETEVVGAVHKWGEFTYMATNHDYLFRTSTGASFSPRDAEISFHEEYYQRLRRLPGTPVRLEQSQASVTLEDYYLNYAEDYGLDGGYDKSQTFNTRASAKPIEIDHCYWQTTSFDHLDSKLYGIRKKGGDAGTQDKCSIATTSATQNAAGSIIPSPAEWTSRNAAHAGTFFGCIFPAGYNKVDPYFAPRNWTVRGKSTGKIVGTLGPGDYFETAGAKGTDEPFFANDATGARNNCRQPAQAEPMDEIGEGGNPWSRHDSRASASLFAEYVANGLRTFPQMPADVMLNASPSGEFGSPLYPVHRFSNFHRPHPDKALLAAQAFLQGSYLGKDGIGGDTFSDTASAFDFPPVSNNLMFRPLKMEGYIQFGTYINGPFALGKVTDLSATGIRDSRITFSVEAHRTQLDDRRPCSMSVDAREGSEQTQNQNTPPFFGGYGLAWGAEVSGKPRYNYLHDFNYWNADHGPMSWQSQKAWRQDATTGASRGIPGNWKGAGAYGVITTFTTVSANDRIDFTTDNLYGMGAAKEALSLYNQGFDRQNNVGLAQGGQEAKSWGVNTFRDSYRQENIIDLSVRIFQQHPRDQLLYDPRTFAVHHFNPDVRYRNNRFVQDDGSEIQLDPIRNIEVQE